MNYIRHRILSILLLISVGFGQDIDDKHFDSYISIKYNTIKALSENIEFNPVTLLNITTSVPNFNNVKILPISPNNILNNTPIIPSNIYNTKNENTLLDNKLLAPVHDEKPVKSQLKQVKHKIDKSHLKIKQKQTTKKYPVKNSSIKGLIAQAESKKNIPSGLLKAIGLVESKLQPYVINYHGRGYSFRNKSEATNFANNLIRQGKTNFSVGCFQLHYQSHAKQFKSVSAMLEPSKNIEYASKLLKQLYKNNGYKWSNAVKRYHSNIDSRNNIYYAKVTNKLGRYV
ncbi:MAG: transglycosylase SLT domain-containing protein [Alphaproteobacteria bacterium]|nr:transglycosylase SLT domain-containing protein [Alphaproteobacteria bacterium]